MDKQALKKVCLTLITNGGINILHLEEDFPDAGDSPVHTWYALGKVIELEKHRNKYPSFKAMTKEWLGGIPTAMRTPWETHEIYEMGYQHGLLDPEADYDTHIDFELAYWNCMAEVITEQVQISNRLFKQLEKC